MDFAWDDDRRIRPLWPQRPGEFPTIAIPATQKNKKVQEIPMLPGLQTLLEKTQAELRCGWIANPEPIDHVEVVNPDWCKPTKDDLAALARSHGNSAIARACGVTETSVRKWLRAAGIFRKQLPVNGGEVDPATIEPIRARATDARSLVARRSDPRLTKEHVSRTISSIGEEAGIVVQQEDEDTSKRLKYASAHDIRRGCAQRLINAGISAETLKLVMRHKDFSTTERYYGATRAAQSAAAEIAQKLAALRNEKIGLEGGTEEAPQLSAEELRKLKALLERL